MGHLARSGTSLRRRNVNLQNSVRRCVLAQPRLLRVEIVVRCRAVPRHGFARPKVLGAWPRLVLVETEKSDTPTNVNAQHLLRKGNQSWAQPFDAVGWSARPAWVVERCVHPRIVTVHHMRAAAVAAAAVVKGHTHCIVNEQSCSFTDMRTQTGWGQRVVCA
eukprot:4597963-Prymnesium_polylepis.1